MSKTINLEKDSKKYSVMTDDTDLSPPEGFTLSAPHKLDKLPTLTKPTHIKGRKKDG